MRVGSSKFAYLKYERIVPSRRAPMPTAPLTPTFLLPSTHLQILCLCLSKESYHMATFGLNCAPHLHENVLASGDQKNGEM